MEIQDKIVDFKQYCNICKCKEYPEEAMPCCECLEHPVNQNSKQPLKFEQSNKSIQKIKIQQERKLLQPKMKIPKRRSKTVIIDSDNIMGKIKEMNNK